MYVEMFGIHCFLIELMCTAAGTDVDVIPLITMGSERKESGGTTRCSDSNCG